MTVGPLLNAGIRPLDDPVEARTWLSELVNRFGCLDIDMMPVWGAEAAVLSSRNVGRAVGRSDWMPGVTGSSFDEVGLLLEIGNATVRCDSYGMSGWARVGVQGFDLGSRPLVREVADRLANEVGAPVLALKRNGFTPHGPSCSKPPFFPGWARVPWGHFELDNWVSADIVAAAPELRSASIPSCYEAVESERGLWWVYRDDPAGVTTEEITALWDAALPGLTHGGEARRAVLQKLRPARKGAGFAQLVEVKSTQTDVRLVVSVDPKSKTPLDRFSAAVDAWANRIEFYDVFARPAERKSEVCFSMDLGNEDAPNPDNGSSEFAELLVLLQAVGAGNEVIHAEIVNV